jgi:hypothetical protein
VEGVPDRRVVAVVGRDDEPVVRPVQLPQQRAQSGVRLLQHGAEADGVLLMPGQVRLLDIGDDEGRAGPRTVAPRTVATARRTHG